MPEIVPWLGPGIAMFRAPAVADEPAGWRLRGTDGAMLAVGLAADADLDTAAGFADDVARSGFGPAPESRLAGLTVRLQADDPFAGPLLAALQARRARVVDLPPDGDDAEPTDPPGDVLVSVSAGPAPARWLELDEHLPAACVWFRVGVEGRLAYLEPPRIGPQPVTHRAVRARRLAAAHRPVEQSAYWEGPRWTGSIDQPPAAVHLLVELLVRDLESSAGQAGHAGQSDEAGQADQSGQAGRVSRADRADRARQADRAPVLPLSRRLRILDLHELRWTDHPILPLPADTDWRDGR